MPEVSKALSGPHDPQADDHATYVPEISNARGANKSATGHLDPSVETFVIAAPLTRGSNSSGRRMEDDVNLVAHALTSEGSDASEDGTGRGAPLVAIPIQDGRNFSDTKKQGGVGVGEDGEPQYTLDTTGGASVATGRSLAYGIRSDAQREGEARTPSPDAEGRVRLRDPGFNVLEEQAPTLDAGAPHSVAQVEQMAVRRLTPVECERLQGFPDGWTEGESDSARYRMLGNAVCVPVAEWIARRIVRVDAETSNSIDSDLTERL